MNPTPELSAPRVSSPMTKATPPGSPARDRVNDSRAIPLMIALSVSPYPVLYLLAMLFERTIEQPFVVTAMATPMILLVVQQVLGSRRVETADDRTVSPLPLPRDEAVRLSLLAMMLCAGQLIVLAVVGKMPMPFASSLWYALSLGGLYYLVFAFPNQLLPGANDSPPYYTRGISAAWSEMLFLTFCLGFLGGGQLQPFFHFSGHFLTKFPTSIVGYVACAVGVTLPINRGSSTLFAVTPGWQRGLRVGLLFALASGLATWAFVHQTESFAATVVQVGIFTLLNFVYAGFLGSLDIEREKEGMTPARHTDRSTQLASPRPAENNEVTS